MPSASEVELPRICSNTGCKAELPPIQEYKWKMCLKHREHERLRVAKRKREAGVTTVCAHPTPRFPLKICQPPGPSQLPGPHTVSSGGKENHVPLCSGSGSHASAESDGEAQGPKKRPKVSLSSLHQPSSYDWKYRIFIILNMRVLGHSFTP
jgi:hypothetical protein